MWHRSRGCRVSDAALRGIDFDPGRWHRRGAPPRGHRDVVVASVAAALLPASTTAVAAATTTAVIVVVVAGSERARKTTRCLYLSGRQLAAPPTNAVPLDARRRRRRLRARPRHAAPHRADTSGRADTHLRQSRAVERLPVVRGAA